MVETFDAFVKLSYFELSIIELLILLAFLALHQWYVWKIRNAEYKALYNMVSNLAKIMHDEDFSFTREELEAELSSGKWKLEIYLTEKEAE